MFIDTKNRTLKAKIVYYGPGLCGKTTNLQFIADYIAKKAAKEIDLVSVATEGDRTLFFDYLPLKSKPIGGLKPTFQLYTVPGQVQYNKTRLVVLKGVDGIVFVVDSQRQMVRANKSSFKELRSNLERIGIDPDSIPIIVQYNKQDLDEAMTPEELDEAVGLADHPRLPAVAVSGEGVFDTLKLICGLVVNRHAEAIKRKPSGSGTRDKPDDPRRSSNLRAPDETTASREHDDAPIPAQPPSPPEGDKRPPTLRDVKKELLEARKRSSLLPDEKGTRGAASDIEGIEPLAEGPASSSPRDKEEPWGEARAGRGRGSGDEGASRDEVGSVDEDDQRDVLQPGATTMPGVQGATTMEILHLVERLDGQIQHLGARIDAIETHLSRLPTKRDLEVHMSRMTGAVKERLSGIEQAFIHLLGVLDKG